MLEVNSKTKTISATISGNILEETDNVLNYYKEQGFSVSRSAFIQSALKSYIKDIQNKIKENGGAK